MHRLRFDSANTNVVVPYVVSKDLVTYLKIIWSHRSFVDYSDVLYQSLGELVESGEWDIGNPNHCELLEKFEAHIGIILITEDLYSLESELVLVEQKILKKKPN